MDKLELLSKNNFFEPISMANDGSCDSIENKLSTIEWLAEQMPGGFFIYRADSSMDILYINQAACRIFGCKNAQEFKELTGNTFYGMVHPDDFVKIQTSIDEQISNDEDNQMDYVVYRIVRKDGEIRWVDDYGHQAQLDGVGTVYYVFIGDITDTRMVEEEKERNRILSNALEEAERANEAKSVFLSNMSHEIRTPITAILGMNEIILRDCEDERILACAENIEKAGTSLLGIISDILDFSKIEAGKLEIYSEEYQTLGLVEDLYNLICFKAEEKGLEIDFQIDPILPRSLVGDSLRIKQVITNLLTNAVKYTEKGCVSLKVEILQKTEKRIRLKISVSDTGIGIKEEDRGRLFKAFDRLDADRTHSIEGTGLGLSITSTILRMMGSRISLESAYGKGSTFSFEISHGIADDTPIGAQWAKEIANSSHLNHKHNISFTAPECRILIVDDTQLNLDVISGLLGPTEIQIDTASGGKECIEKFSAGFYDLIFLDYRMPQMNGIETLQRMKEEYPEKTDFTPIISLTASAVAGEREHMLRAGFTDYLTKPIIISDMMNMLLKYLPKEKVNSREKNNASMDLDPKEFIPKKLLHISWLNVEEGIEYCGSPQLYVHALKIFADTILDKASLIEEALSEGDIELFTVTVHSLKSSSLTLGIDDFSSKARELELAGKQNDIKKIQERIPAFLSEYRDLKPVIENAVSI